MIWLHESEMWRKAKLCYMNTGRCIVYIKKGIYKDIAEGFEARFDTLNYELERSFPRGKNENLITLMKVELGGKMMIEFAVYWGQKHIAIQ